MQEVTPKELPHPHSHTRANMHTDKTGNKPKGLHITVNPPHVTYAPPTPRTQAQLTCVVLAPLPALVYAKQLRRWQKDAVVEVGSQLLAQHLLRLGGVVGQAACTSSPVLYLPSLLILGVHSDGGGQWVPPPPAHGVGAC